MTDAPTEETAADGAHKKKAIEAAAFVVVGFGMSQVIRLGGNIALTRLLVPEIFGIISLARVFFMGLAFFSDIGLEPAVIRSRRAGDPVFLDTAWTLQILRNLLLAVGTLAIGYPVSILYEQPVLAVVIPLIGVVGIIDGFRSTSLTLLDKELQQRKMTYIELGVQTASLITMIGAAYFMRNIWALVIGEFVGTTIRLFWSHAINRARPNKFALEWAAVKELLSFGKWIFVSTALMFLASQADRFLLGKFFSMAWFGVYNIAVNLAELPKQVIQRLNGKVIYPLITKYAHLSHEELRGKIRAARWRLLLALAALLAFFGSAGDIVIHILYDQRYRSAAWILPLLAFGMWPLILLSTIEGSLLAIGKSKYAAMGNLAKFLYMIIVLPLAHRFGGETAVILAIALNDIPSYIILNIALAKERLSLLRQDAALTVLLIGMTAFWFALRLIAGLGIPGMSPLFANR